MTLDDIRSAWSADTSYWPNWSPENPAHGQCAVTALLVQDLLGGDIWRGQVNGLSHYWNRADGESVDLTLTQFALPRELRIDVPVNREILLANADTARRYQLLRNRATASEKVASGNAKVAPVIEGEGSRESIQTLPPTQPKEG